ncbi:MAG TPA: hypothetical protein VGC13_15835 [Longimicrobium sp.]|jgi:hypothetical protein|uniref:hypothetical protein n=1 Tax=Longimicrobium sp. TaxID=2029185 RepID=UPI002ED93781
MSTSIVYKLEFAGSIEDYPGERVVRVRLAEGSMAPWTLGLCMLKESVVDTFSIHSEDRAFKLHVERAVDEADENAGTIGVARGSTTVRASLSPTELDRWVHFFLSYLRDGYGSVDHMDVDVDGPDPMALVLHVPAAAAPVSRDEAFRRLGLQ